MRYFTTHGAYKGAISLIALLLFLFPASAQTHPNEDIYRYRVKDYVPQEPWHSYPEGLEREQWECFDDTTKMFVICSSVAGSLESFRYIFQRDMRKLRFIDRPTGGLY